MKYYKINLDGKDCLYDNFDCLVDDLYDMIVIEGEENAIVVQAIEMITEEYENLGDFDGW